ncbi:MAG: outer membrane beta-barrel protein [Candidatus Acidiferrales bacterium]
MTARLWRLLGLVLLVSLVPLATHAQDKVEFFGGYSYMRVDASPSVNPGSGGFNLSGGWELSGQYKFADWLGAVADIDGHSGSPSDVSTSIHTFLFGPQVSWPTRISPFAHVLVGGAHVSTGAYSDTSLSVAIGGGIDTRLVDHIYWRVIQGDYLLTRFFGNTQNNARVSTGIVFKF